MTEQLLRGVPEAARDRLLRSIEHQQRVLEPTYPHLVRRYPYYDPETDAVSYVCGLTDKGVAEYGGKTFDEHSIRTLDHELDISLFHIALQELCDGHGLVLTWRQTDLKHGIDPDAQFSITNPKREGKNTRNFFLELERAKLGAMKDGKYGITRKLEHYYDHYDTDECEKQWGFRTFRVAVIMRSAERRDNQLKAMQSSLNHQMFWLGARDNQLSGFRTPKGDTFSFLNL